MENNGDMDFKNILENIKKEPQDDLENLKHIQEPLNPSFFEQSIKMKFVRDQNKNYSVLLVPKLEDSSNFECSIKQETLDIKEEENSTVRLMEIKEEKQGVFTKEKSSFITCKKCFYVNVPKLVRRHHQRVHAIPRHSCLFCAVAPFKDPFSLDCHILRKHGDVEDALSNIKRRIFKCDLCEFKTLKTHNIRRHLSTHKEIQLNGLMGVTTDRSRSSRDQIKYAISCKVFQCYHCEYVTKDKGAIYKHLRLHRDKTQWPYACKRCGLKFNEKNSLDSHIIKNHVHDDDLLKVITNRVYECELCHYKDVRLAKVMRHKQAKHVKKETKNRNRKAKPNENKSLN